MLDNAVITGVKSSNIEDIQDIVREGTRVLARGGGTKPGLSTPPSGWVPLEMARIAGVLEYEPGEMTFTALAGTKIADVETELSAHSQYLPFEPLLVERGATLGGTVVSGLSGPGRYHYGGVRDFLLGIRFVNSEGQLVCGGGKVVKNAAGFDLPKLMIGSLGGLGILVELTFKVFPQPQAQITLRLECKTLESALEAMQQAADSQLDIDALELIVSEKGHQVWIKISGLKEGLPRRLQRFREKFATAEVAQGEVESQFWREVRELEWAPEGWTLVKAAITPGKIAAIEMELQDQPVMRRYSVGGQVAWFSQPEPLTFIDTIFDKLGLSGLVIFGSADSPRIGDTPARPFYQRIKAALDPEGRFVEV